MALDLTAIRAAVAEQIQAAVDRGVNVYGGYIPDSPVAPAVVIQPDEDYVAYHGSFSRTGVAAVRLRLRLFIPPGPGVDGQMVLDEFLSAGTGNPNSVLDAVNADLTFGGVVESGVIREPVAYEGRLVSGLPESQTTYDVAHLLLELTTHRTA